MTQTTTAYNAKNERVKRDYLRHLQEARGRAQRTVDAARKAIQDCAFDVIVLDNYYAPDLVQTLEPVVVQSGYVLKFNTDKPRTRTITGTRAYTSEGCRGVVI